MADGKFIIGADGKFRVRSGGAFDTCEECCGNVCANCPDLVPTTLEFVMAGTDITGCCERAGGFVQSYLAVGAPDANGTYSLSSEAASGRPCADSGRCGYGYRELSFCDIESHTGTTCGSAYSTNANMLQLTARFYDDGGGLRLWVQATLSRNTTNSSVLPFFQGKSDILTNCADIDGAVIANEIACGAGPASGSVQKCWQSELGQGFGDGNGTITVNL